MFGKAAGFTAGLDLSALDGADGFRLDGVDANENSGRSVSDAGDVNGDGFGDLIIGAPGAATYTGESYVVFGKATGFTAGLALADLDGSDGFRLDGIDTYDYSGCSVSGAGDINGDGFADLVVGAYYAGTNGESYVVFGKDAGFTADVDLSSLDGNDGFRLDGAAADDKRGQSVSGAGDVNGDGFADLIIGAYSADPNGDSQAGESYVVFGKASGFTTDLDLSALDGADGFRLEGIDASDRSGYSVSDAGDVNGDGFDDLIVGAFRATSNGNSQAGESYVVFGKASEFTAGLDLSALDGTDGLRLDGIDGSDRSGRSVSGAGDVDGDGFADLIIGAYRADPNGNSSAGESYVVFGFDSGAVTHQGTSAAETLTGDGAANVIIGDLGADTLVGGGGADALRGGAGDDVLDVADLSFLKLDGGTGSDSLRLSGAGLNLDFTAIGSQKVESIERIELAGLGAEVTLDRISILNLSEASNSLVVDGSTSEKLSLTDEGWSLTADNGATHVFANGAAIITVADTLSRDISGGALDDTLLGGDGVDALAGGAGNDTLAGGAGNDALDGSDDTDTADYSGAAGLVSINLSSGAVQDGDGGSDTLTSIENVTGSTFNDTLIGDSLANTLTGGAGVDRLDGRGGDDVLVGGAGNDIYTITDVVDVVTELVGEGTDRVNAFVDFTNPDNVELLVGKFASVGLTLTGNATKDQITGANKINSPDAIFGLGGNDLLVGLVGDDVINGGTGNDRIFGNSGADTISGGLGNDRVTGQQGADTFVHGVGDGRDKITDFNVTEDLLDLTAHGFASFAAVQAEMSDESGDALINLTGSDSVILQGIASAMIGIEDVLI